MLRFGLMGCGSIAKRHANILSSGEVEGATLSAVHDVNPERASEFGAQFGVPGYASLDEFLAQDFDVACILTPSGLHAQHTVDAANAGKHVLVEKPMALRLDDADRMIRACDAAHVKLFVVKQNRFNVPVQKTREALEAGRFGKLVLGTVRVRWSRDQRYYDQDPWRGTWARDGGVLANQASHHIDLLEWFFGPVVSVYAVSRTALARIEAEDTAIATLEFANGALGIIEATTATRPRDMEGSLSILGEKGSVVIGGFAVNKLEHWAFTEPTPDDNEVFATSGENPPDPFGYGHRAYYQHIIRCFEDDSAALVDGLEGRRSLELITALYESIETGAPVTLRLNARHVRLGVLD